MGNLWKVCIFTSKILIARYMLLIGDHVGGIFTVMYGVLEFMNFLFNCLFYDGCFLSSVPLGWRSLYVYVIL
jgi:hypothetical protein